MLVVYNRTFKNSAVILSSSPPLVVILRRILIRSWHSEWLNTSWWSADDGDNSMAPHDHHSHRICHKFFCQKFQPMLNTQKGYSARGLFLLIVIKIKRKQEAFETLNNHLTMWITGLTDDLHHQDIKLLPKSVQSSLTWLLLTPAQSCQCRCSLFTCTKL